MLIKYLLLIFIILKVYYILNIYQQSHYELKAYIKYFIRNFLYINLFVILISLLTLYYKSYLVSYIIIDIYSVIFYTKFKVKLNFSKRVIRLSIFLILFIFLTSIYPIYVLPFLEILIIPFLKVMEIFEHLINNIYKKKAIKKLTSFRGLKIAITGSYGKTTTKFFLYELIKNSYPTLVMPLSYNTPLGISRIINSNDLDKYECIIFEMGMSKRGDIKELMKFIKPSISIITNVGFMHLDSLGSIQNILNEKSYACNMNNRINIINVDNKYLRNNDYKYPYLGYGIDNGVYRYKIYSYSDYMLFDFLFKDKCLYTFKTYLKGSFNLENLVPAIIVASLLKIDYRLIYEAVLNAKTPKCRLELKRYNNLTILDDSYNSNIKGATEGLAQLRDYNCLKICITPLFAELDSIDKKYLIEYYKILDSSCDLIFFVGYFNSKAAYKYLKDKNKAYIFDSFKSSFKAARRISIKKEVVVLIENDMPDIYKRGFLND